MEPVEEASRVGRVLDRLQIERRILVEVEGLASPLWVSSVADLVLRKLWWHGWSRGASSRQWDDVVALLRAQYVLNMLLVDTGVFVAAADLDDRHHHSCAALIETHPGPLVTTSLVIAEAGWLIRRQLDIATEAARDSFGGACASDPTWARTRVLSSST